MSLPKVLLIGKDGQVGWELQICLRSMSSLIAIGREELDLTDSSELEKIVMHHQPDIVVNAAAYTAVDLAEKESELAIDINAKVPERLAKLCERIGALLFHYSTDYVFDGNAQVPYLEEDTTSPQNVYGESKCLGEELIQKTNSKFCIVRTSWVFGLRRSNFLLTMLSLAQEKEELSIVEDQRGSPTWSRTIAQISSQMIQSYWLNKVKNMREIYHLSGAGETNWFEFTQAIVEKARGLYSDALVIKGIKGIPTEAYPTPAKRPKYSKLNCQKLEDAFHLKVPDWEQQLHDCLYSGSFPFIR